MLLIRNETQNDESRNRKKNHSLVPYHCQYTRYWLYLWTGKKFPQRSNRYQMGYFSIARIVRSLDVERSFVEKMVQKSRP